MRNTNLTGSGREAHRPRRFALVRRLGPAVVALGLVLVTESPSFADNPIVQTNFTSDPAPMVSNGRVYLITTHD